MDLTPESLDLSLDELEEIEDILDAPASRWDECKQGALMKAMVYIVRRRDDPSFTIEDAGRMRMSELDEAMRPTDAGGTAAS